MNWGMIIHEIVARGISQIGKKPSYISPFIMHIYAYHHCTTVDEDDKLVTARDEITYKLQPVPHESSTKSDPPIPEAPPSSVGSPPENFRGADSLPPPSPRHHPASPHRPPQSPHAARPGRTPAAAPWQNVDLSMW